MNFDITYRIIVSLHGGGWFTANLANADEYRHAGFEDVAGVEIEAVA